MRTFGKLKEIVRLIFRKNTNLVTVEPKAATASVSDVVFQLPDVTGGTTELIDSDTAQTVTNKTIDDDQNIITNIDITNVKTDAAKPSRFLARDGSGVIDQTKVVPAGDVVGTTDTQTLSAKTLTAPKVTAGGGIDTDVAGSLALGAATATSVNIGKSGVTTTVKGDLQVDGTTTTVNSATLDVADANITVNKGGNTAAADASVAGLTVEGDDGGGPIEKAKIGFDSALSSLFKCGVPGAEKEVADVSSAQTLTNKTLVATNNSISAITNAEIDAAAAIAGSKISPDFVAQNIVTSGTIATSSDIKTTGTTNSSLVSKELSAKPTSPAAGTQRMYPKNDGKWYFLDDAGNELEVGSGAGSSKINYIANSRFETDTNGWAVSGGGGLSITRISADSPRDNTVGTAAVVKVITSSVAGDYVYYAFSMDQVDLGKRLSISFDIEPNSGYTSGDFEVYVYDITNSNTLTVANLGLASARHTYQSYFSATTGTSYELRIKTLGVAANAGINITNVVLGPQEVIQATPMTDWEDKSSDYSFDGITTSTLKVFTKRSGDTLKLRGYCINASTTASNFALNLPSSITLNTGILGTGANIQHLGSLFRLNNASGTEYNIYNDSSSNQRSGIFFFDGSTTTKIYIAKGQGTTLLEFTKIAGNSLINSTSYGFSFDLEVPIAEWAGSSVGLANNRVEFVSNSDTTNVSNTTSFQYGTAGEVVPNRSIGTEVVKRVRFLTNIQATDTITVQVKRNNYEWTDIGNSLYGYKYAPTYIHAGLSTVGITGNTTDIDVSFAAGGSWTGQAWATEYTAGTRWRVVKSSNPLSVGLATDQMRESVWDAGDIKSSIRDTLTGWIQCTGNSIGDTGSGATYTNNTYWELYNHLWGLSGISTTSGDPFVISSSKGASAAIDWAAGKTITVDFRTYKYLKQKESGDNLGVAIADLTKRPTSSLTTNSPGNHTHTTNFGQVSTQSGGGHNVIDNGGSTVWTRANGAAAAGSHTHSITGGGDAETRPKSVTVNYFIKT